MNNQLIELTRKTLEENSGSDVKAIAEGIARIMEALNSQGGERQITIGDFSDDGVPWIIRAQNLGYMCSLRVCSIIHTIAWWRGNMEDTKEQIIDFLTEEHFKSVASVILGSFKNSENVMIQSP